MKNRLITLAFTCVSCVLLPITVIAAEVCDSNALVLYDNFEHGGGFRNWVPGGDGQFLIENGQAKLTLTPSTNLHSVWLGMGSAYLSDHPVPQVIEADLTLDPASTVSTPENGIGIRLDGIFFSDGVGDVVASMGVDKKILIGGVQEVLAIHIFRKGNEATGHIGTDLIPWQIIRHHDGKPHTFRMAWNGEKIVFVIDGEKIFEYLPPFVIHPAQAPEVKVNAFVFPGSSVVSYIDNVYFGDATAAQATSKCIPAKKQTVVEPPSDLGRAIIIAGGGAHKQNTLFEFSDKLSQRMYGLLKERGFNDTDVIFMSPKTPDIDSDGFEDPNWRDYILLNAHDDLTNAFAQAAQTLQFGQQFVFYLHGHANPELLKINREYGLPAQELKDLLATLPLGVQQIIILDTCYSGSFLDDLAGVENRIVLSSADAATRAWNVEITNFSDKLIGELRRGVSVVDAFRAAENMIIGNSTLFRDQKPQLDDDGDGQHTSRDGVHAGSIYLGQPGIHAATAPDLVHVHPRMDLDKDTTTATLWLKTYPSGDGIREVQAVVTKPNFQYLGYQDERTHFDQETVLLGYNPVQDRYEVVYDHFFMPGIWRIYYKAQNIEGAWSDILSSEVNAPGMDVPATVSVSLNQNRYTTGNRFLLDVILNGSKAVDLYVALVFPEGFFRTLSYPEAINLPNAVVPYQQNISLSGKQTYPPVLDLNLPSGLTLGHYSACGVLVLPDMTPALDKSNWVYSDCLDFEVY